MRIMLTVLGEQGDRDVVIDGDDDTTVAGVSEALADHQPLAQVVRLPRARAPYGMSSAGPPSPVARVPSQRRRPPDPGPPGLDGPAGPPFGDGSAPGNGSEGRHRPSGPGPSSSGGPPFGAPLAPGDGPAGRRSGRGGSGWRPSGSGGGSGWRPSGSGGGIGQGRWAASDDHGDAQGLTGQGDDWASPDRERPAGGPGRGRHGSPAPGTPHPEDGVTWDVRASPPPSVHGAARSWNDRPHGQALTLWRNGRPLDPRAPAKAVLHDGDKVTLDPLLARATIVEEPGGVAEVRVVGGPAAGAVHRLGLGVHVIGSDPMCAITVADPALAPESVTIRVTPDAITAERAPRATPGQAPRLKLKGRWADEVAELTARVAEREAAELAAESFDDSPELASRPLTDAVEWPEDALLSCGSSLFTLTAIEPRDAHLTPRLEGGVAYNRPPRLTRPELRRTFKRPKEPSRTEGMRLQLLAAFLPMVIGLTLAYVLKQWYFLLFALMTPVIMVGQWWSDRRHGKKQHRQAIKEYKERLDAYDEAVERARAEDELLRRSDAPDPAQVLLTAIGPRRRLWERRVHDDDALRLRVGLADLPANLDLAEEQGGPIEPPICRAVPVALAMRRLGVAGVTGPRDTATGLAGWLIGQAATLHSPRDLAIVIISAHADGERRWGWARWLPHCAPRGGEDCVALIGADPESAAQRVSELAALIDERQNTAIPELGKIPTGWDDLGGPEPPAFSTYDVRPYDVLVVLDGAQALRGLPSMPQVLRQGPRAGVYTLALDDDERLLPEECATVAACAPDGRVHLRGGGLDVIGPVLADRVSPSWCDRLARALAPIRDVSREDGAAQLPQSVRLLDLLGLRAPTGREVSSRWLDQGTTRALIGTGPDGPFAIDLSLDGPHGLVAGTTGAGKSELLQSLICSLAVSNRPDQLTFVLIDYKGGAAFKECTRLPHTVGMVSDLDGHLTQRALESLGAEIRRRERLLLAAGAKDIEDYTGHPLPRLVLIIDEFAALVSELPDFVTGLVDIARRGRSLGIHLILATQRPAGVVTADIQANTSLRIALRVTEPAESSDVIDLPDAAHISKSTPGRCYVKSGAGPATAVQTARVGGRAPEPLPAPSPGPHTGVPGPPVHPGLTGPTWAPQRTPARVRVVDIDWRSLGRALPAPPQPTEESAVTDLSILADAMIEAARLAGVPEQPRPWLEPLPAQIVLTLPTGGPHLAPVPDLPSAQPDSPHGPGESPAAALDGQAAVPGAEAALPAPSPNVRPPGNVPARGMPYGTATPPNGTPNDDPATAYPVAGPAGGTSSSAATPVGAPGGTPSNGSPDAPPVTFVEPYGSRSPGSLPAGEVEPLPFGMTDRPWAQDRCPLTLDLAHGGHLLIAGAPRSGRSTALRTIAGAIAAYTLPSDVHVHAVDCGSGALLPLVAMPHCGAVVTRDQLDRVERLLTRLRTEVGRRQQLLAEAGHASLAEYRQAGHRLPWLVLMLDRWEGYVAAFENYDYGRLLESLLQLLREGPAVGLRGVVTGDRSSLLGQVSTVFDDRLLLRLSDPSDYGLAGFPLKGLPSSMPPGRALSMGEHGIVEHQIALLTPDPAGPAQVATLQSLARSTPIPAADSVMGSPFGTSPPPDRYATPDLTLQPGLGTPAHPSADPGLGTSPHPAAQSDATAPTHSADQYDPDEASRSTGRPAASYDGASAHGGASAHDGASVHGGASAHDGASARGGTSSSGLPSPRRSDGSRRSSPAHMRGGPAGPGAWHWEGEPPLRVDALPLRITAGQALALDPAFSPPSPLWALMGAGGDALAPLGLDLMAYGPAAVIAGPARSGRSSVLVTAAQSLIRAGTPVIAVAPRRSPLRDLDAAVAILDGNATDLQELVADLRHYVLLIDDAELINPDSPLGTVLEDQLRSGRDGDHGLLIAGTTSDLTVAYRGFAAEARKGRTGLLLSVQSQADGDLFTIRLPRGVSGGPPGRGLLVTTGTITPIQAAVPDGE
ncbi:FtsK/SpoIIIE domain-containing protein [Nonomuraea sp. NPDC023979]|uniref:FtsK/SpoIIIE domain-containing protein n=1 Tax=Nonomuraea sp. NPDC023979 TaxID=3154796 RepID=UPI0033E66E19